MDMLKIRRKRNATGSVAEFTAVVPVFALFILIPMMNVGAVALRTTFITVAARDAVHKAIKARSFETDLPGAPSAKSIAQAVAVALANLAREPLATPLLPPSPTPASWSHPRRWKATSPGWAARTSAIWCHIRNISPLMSNLMKNHTTFDVRGFYRGGFRHLTARVTRHTSQASWWEAFFRRRMTEGTNSRGINTGSSSTA